MGTDRMGAPFGPVLMCGVDWRAVVCIGSENTRRGNAFFWDGWVREDVNLG